MRYSVSMVIAVLIHAGSILGMSAFSDKPKLRTFGEGRIVTTARILTVTTSVRRNDSALSRPKAPKLTKTAARKTIALAQMDALDVTPTLAISNADEVSAAEGLPSTAESTSTEIPTVEGNPANYGHNPKPEYPRRSIEMREEGRVLVKALVDSEGKVIDCELAESSGFERLDLSAVKAVKSWLFVAEERNGQGIKSWVLVPVVFNLKTHT